MGNVFVPAVYKEPKENSTAYAWTCVMVSKETRCRVMALSVQNYSASEMAIYASQEKCDYKAKSYMARCTMKLKPPV